jgi:hypothetical protein
MKKCTPSKRTVGLKSKHCCRDGERVELFEGPPKTEPILTMVKMNLKRTWVMKILSGKLMDLPLQTPLH